MEIWIIKIIAILAAILIGWPLTEFLAKKLRELRNEPKSEVGERIAKWLGFFERAIIVLIWFWGQYQFIGFWFAGKIIGNWNRRDKNDEGAFSSYLLTTGISILCAVAVAATTEYFLDNL